MTVEASLDQSSSATGVVIWVHGEPKWVKTIYEKPNILFIEKCRNAADNILLFLDEITKIENNGVITKIVLEKFVDYIPPKKAASLVKLGMFSFYLTARLEEKYGRENILFIGKGNISKKTQDRFQKVILE
jgi:hypothetical protein